MRKFQSILWITLLSSWAFGQTPNLPVPYRPTPITVYGQKSETNIHISREEGAVEITAEKAQDNPNLPKTEFVNYSPSEIRQITKEMEEAFNKSVPLEQHESKIDDTIQRRQEIYESMQGSGSQTEAERNALVVRRNTLPVPAGPLSQPFPNGSGAPSLSSSGSQIKIPLPSLKHFGVETFYFQIVLGAMAVQQTLSKMNAASIKEMMTDHPLSDSVRFPVALEHFMDAMKDPVGHLAFYNFMIANKWVTEGMRDWALGKGPKAQARLFRYLIPGLGMTAGSIVSHLTGDLYQLFSACHWDNVKRGQQRQRLSMPAIPDGKQDSDPCEEAFKQWTLEKKFYVYAPALTSMLLSTVLGAGVKWTASAMAYSKVASPIGVLMVARPAFQKVKDIALKEILIRGVTIGLSATPLGVVPNSLRILGAAGHASNIAIFLYADTVIRDGVEWIMGNLFRADDLLGPYLRPFIPGENFQELDEALTKISRDTSAATWQGENSSVMDFLKKFSTTFEEHRHHSNKDAQSAHDMWQDKIMGFMTSVRMALYFYEHLIDDFKAKEMVRRYENKEITVPPKKLFNNLAFRDYLLYGVWVDAKKHEYESLDDASADYLKNPDRLEGYQLERVKESAKHMCEVGIPKEADREPFFESEKEILDRLCANLNSGDKEKIAQGFGYLNHLILPPNVLRYDNRRVRKTGRLSTSYRLNILLTEIRDHFGDPRPLSATMEGLSYAYEVNPVVQKNKGTFPFENFGYIKMEKVSDIMAYKMVCGSERPEDVIFNREGFRLRFNPPKIVDIKAPANFCYNNFDFADPQSLRDHMKIATKPSSLMYREKIQTEKGEYKGIGDLIVNNLNEDIKKFIQSGNEEFWFANWWTRFDPYIFHTLETLKNEYKTVVVRLLKNLYQEDSAFNTGQVSNSLITILKQELRVNLIIQGQLLRFLHNQKNPNAELPADLFADVEHLKRLYPNSVLSKADEKSWWKRLKNKADEFLRQSAGINSDKLLAKQRSPWNLDVRSLQNQQTPKIFKFQAEAEKLMRHQELILFWTIHSDDRYEQSEEYYLKSLKEYTEAVGQQFKDYNPNDYQKLLILQTTAQISQILSQMTVYIKTAQMFDYDDELRDDNSLKKAMGAGGIKAGGYRPGP